MPRSRLDQFLDMLRALPPHVNLRVHWRHVGPWLHEAGRAPKYLVAEAADCGRKATCTSEEWYFQRRVGP